MLRILKNLPENRISDLLFSEASLSDVTFFISETHEGKTEKINALQLSDGTLRCLAIVAALLSEKEKGMIVIEEMDSGIHPGRIQTMVQAISELAQRRELDVMITTHSASLLNSLSRENLTGVDVVYRCEDSGASEIISLVDIEKMPELLAAGKLGDVVTSGKILEYIKSPKRALDYSWLEVRT